VLGLLASLVHQAIPSSLPPAAGWHELPNTALRSVCPPNGFGQSNYDFAYHCVGVVYAWNSAIFDTKRNRLVIWGGGHRDYLGNELYAIDLNTLRVQRLTDPALPIARSVCPESLANDSQPNSRHTYDGLAYLEHVDRMFVFGGSLSDCGYMSRGTWTFSFETERWERRNPKGPIPNAMPGVVSAYDPNTRMIFLHDDKALYSYDVDADRYQRLSGEDPIDYHMTGVIDPLRRKFVIVGAGAVYVYDIGRGSRFARRTLKTTGGAPIVESDYPGLAYHPATHRIIAWNGGDTVYSLDLDSGAWSSTTAAGGPGPARENGTYKRWSYAPAPDVFILVNSADHNARIFRLRPDSQPLTPPGPPATPRP
jgi:hypothetical protein